LANCHREILKLSGLILKAARDILERVEGHRMRPLVYIHIW
jgi:hypothetical protein